MHKNQPVQQLHLFFFLLIFRLSSSDRSRENSYSFFYTAVVFGVVMTCGAFTIQYFSTLVLQVGQLLFYTMYIPDHGQFTISYTQVRGKAQLQFIWQFKKPLIKSLYFFHCLNSQWCSQPAYSYHTNFSLFSNCKRNRFQKNEENQ